MKISCSISVATYLLLVLVENVSSFTHSSSHRNNYNNQKIRRINGRTITQLYSGETAISMDPKEAVKIFGRLAEKYIMLDSSGGLCCYSGCTDCEYRLPGGGYRMADQSSARPKWIPNYDERIFESAGKEHTSKWNTEIFTDGPAVTKEEFVSRVIDMEFIPPLGGPYMSKSAGAIDDFFAVETLFDILADGKEKLTKHRMGTRIKELANGNEGLIWSDFMNGFAS
mmetsp:Transcript_24109/g.29690  ORF Transcript_24109/g.29690 Transcript_24109/m.29690 type:complete len:226 (+) Transcript_24109:107-784(+)